MKIFNYRVNGVPVQTGDIICTINGEGEILPGQFWRLLGRLVPGAVDHVAMYVGPGGRCIEAGGHGVVSFEVIGGEWHAEKMTRQRGLFIDSLYGVAYPLKGKGLKETQAAEIRMGVGSYCIAQVGKSYNLNFLNPETEEAFYCSQLAYKAYKQYGIDLNTGQGVPNLGSTERIVFPQEIWSGCEHTRGNR